MGQTDSKYSLVRRKFIFDKDYEMLDKWWRQHGGSHAPNKNLLSDTGIVVELNREPIAVIFMYHMNSKTCMAEFFTVNPKASKEHRNVALNYLIEISKEWAEKANYCFVYVSTNVKKYIKRLQDNGFVVLDKNAVHCFYEVR
jgi:hypothetical protein